MADLIPLLPRHGDGISSPKVHAVSPFFRTAKRRRVAAKPPAQNEAEASGDG